MMGTVAFRHSRHRFSRFLKRQEVWSGDLGGKAVEGIGDGLPALAALLSAIKATAKGGVGKLRERPQGRRCKDGEQWPALQWPTWRPDIRAAVISKDRVSAYTPICTRRYK